jgi:hypothetical protein
MLDLDAASTYLLSGAMHGQQQAQVMTSSVIWSAP